MNRPLIVTYGDLRAEAATAKAEVRRLEAMLADWPLAHRGQLDTIIRAERDRAGEAERFARRCLEQICAPDGAVDDVVARLL